MATMAFSAYGGWGGKEKVGRGLHSLNTRQLEAELLTLAAVKVSMGRKMMDSLASGMLVQTAARMAMMAPD